MDRKLRYFSKNVHTGKNLRSYQFSKFVFKKALRSYWKTVKNSQCQSVNASDADVSGDVPQLVLADYAAILALFVAIFIFMMINGYISEPGLLFSKILDLLKRGPLFF